MVIFIDESGIHKQTGHSTGSVVYVEVKHLETFENKLRQIEKDLKIVYFHWAEERWFMKNKFISRIFDLDFTVKVAVFVFSYLFYVTGNYDQLFDVNLFIYISVVDDIFQHLITEKAIKSIYIDGEKPKWYEHKLKKVLRDKGISLKKLRTVRSKSEVGIQLADALASLIRYYHDNPQEKDAKKWVAKLKKEKKLAFELLVNQ